MELYTLVLGLDVLGNPVNVVKGVVGGTIDLFYEPIKVWTRYRALSWMVERSLFSLSLSLSPLSPSLSVSLPFLSLV